MASENIWAEVEFGRRKPGTPNSWEELSTSSYRVMRPTVFCLSGNGTTTLRDANGFCKHAESYLNLMKGQDGTPITDRVDIVGFKYAKKREDSETGGLTPEFIESFIEETLLPLFVDANGERLSLDQARKNMSQITFFTYCAGAQELSSIMRRLNYELSALGYRKFERDLIGNSSMNISFAPLDNTQNFVPSVRVLSMDDDVVGTDIGLMLSENERKELDGVELRKDPVGKIYGTEMNLAPAGGINIITSSLVNASSANGNDHYSSIVARDADWSVSEFVRDGRAFRSGNADCVSQMMAWSLCRAVENSEANYYSDRYIPNGFYDELEGELTSIRDSFSREELGRNPETLYATRKAEYDRARAVEVSNLSSELATYREPKAVVFSELKKATNFKVVAQILEKNNYYYLDELLDSVPFLTEDEKSILRAAGAHKTKARERERWHTMSATELMSHLKRAKSLDEIKTILGYTGYSYATDYLPWLLGEKGKGYPLTKDESKQILTTLKADRDREISRNCRPKWEQINEDIDTLPEDYGFAEIVELLERNDYYAAADVLPKMSHKITKEQMTAIVDMSRAKRCAIADRAKMIEFPSYDDMVNMLNNADSLEEAIAMLERYNYCGVDAVLPAVMVLTDEEKREILMSHRQEMAMGREK